MTRLSLGNLPGSFDQTAYITAGILALVLLLSSFEQAVADRKLRYGWQAPDPLACGFYNSSDPRDPGVAHQACFGSDGSVLFCW